MLLVILARCSATPHEGLGTSPSRTEAILKQFRELEPEDRVKAFQALAELRSLRHVAEQVQLGSAEAPTVGSLIRDAQHRLLILLPQLNGSDVDILDQLQQHAVAALAAGLAPRGPSRLSRALTLVNVIWFCGCLLLLAAAVSLAGIYVAALAMQVPLAAWEALGYAASLWVVHR